MADRLAPVTTSARTAGRPRLLLVDGHSMAYRAFYALPDTLATTSGQVTNAVYGFTSMLTNLLRDEEPTHVAVAFDAGRVTFRTERFTEYKAQREATPEVFRGQVPLIREVLESLRIPALQREGIEADDILATLARRGTEQGMEVLVCSGDRDTLQLVTEDVTVLYPKKGVSELARMTPEAVEAKYKVPPQRYPDLAALVGETSDNLPGIPGVGPGVAAKWITEFGDLDSLLERRDEVGGKRGDALREHVDQVRLNRELNALLTDVDLPLGIDDLAVAGFDREAVHRVSDTLEFGALRDRLLAVDPAGEDASASPAAGIQVDRHVGALADWLAGRSEQLLGIDVTGVRRPGAGDAWQVALGTAGTDGHAEAVVLDLAEIDAADEQALLAWLADPGAPKAVHGAKAAWHMLSSRGADLVGVQVDTELAAYLCYPDQRGYDLGDLVVRHLGRELAVDEGGAQGALDLDLEAGPPGADAAARAVAVVDLAAALGERLVDRGARGLLDDVELPLSAVLARMEATGIAADTTFLTELEQLFADRVEASAAEAYDVIGREVNLGSPKQLQEVLFDQLGMPKTKKIKTGYTTDAASLQDLFAKTEHPFLAHLLAHRDAARLRTTVEGLLKAVHPDGRIRTTFQQTIAATGRLSSTDPNLQNIPIRTEAGRRIRRAFTVGEGYAELVTADYSQIEMRIMAHLSGDEGLIEAFRTGEDLHRYVGSRVFDVAPEDVSPEMRAKVKAMSYGLAYGLSAFGLSQQLTVPAAEAQALMDDYFTRFGGVRDYLTGVVDEARATGYTATILGRRRYLPDLTSDNRQRRQMAERMALNAPIQGSAADIIKLAMLGVQRELDEKELRSRLLLQVHDELVVEVAAGEREVVEDVLRRQMCGAVELDVPLDVSVGSGQTWHDAAH
ncbi:MULTISPECIES: DNA polymerase I [unclassified Isoptericola]|uniref:DNA polymerase I n=1 Tax=unclassified Isoptericola TaxID=2623355 RepID=UPI0027124057|nr:MULTISPECIES: DNA polymerase I [unclassified Isoptericola]MDO8144968.1 DNA polymerase I [Isoptericola sp. 178]MDO8148601.1 DNA polymerase I [Isoptericola sp. b515]